MCLYVDGIYYAILALYYKHFNTFTASRLFFSHVQVWWLFNKRADPSFHSMWLYVPIFLALST